MVIYLRNLYKAFFISVFMLLFMHFANGQKIYSLHYIFSDNGDENLKSFYKDKREIKNLRDTVSIFAETEETVQKLRSSGYLSASIDSIRHDSLKYTAWLFIGEKYEWATLRKGNVPDDFLQGTGFRKKQYAGKPFNYFQLEDLNKKILRNCENNGYPFAKVKLDSISTEGNIFGASLSLEKNKLIFIDSIIIKGTSTVVPVYIYDYTAVKPGDVYNEAAIRRISSRLKELAFVHEVKSSQILFSEKDTKLYLFLENRKASQFDGVIGLLPDEAKEGKFNITGEVHLKLQNSLKRGEIIELNWKQLPVQSQDLKVHALYPFLLNTPFGIDANLSIFKKDTTYIDVIKNLGVQYSFTGNNYLKAFINDKQSDLQASSGFENITVLPDYADITTVSYGATVHYEKLDYRLNPRKGFAFEITGSTGNRTIRKNSDINPALYDSVDLSSVTYQSQFGGDYYFSPGGRHVIDIGNISGYIYNPKLFINELYRIGGLRSLRGFDEESIYASTFTIGKIEYRYLIDQNSFLFTFFNAAWYENKNRNNYVTDIPLGFGAGIDFETKLGIMSVSYALGKQFDNPVLFRNGKIHFGIINYF